jgi:hypothetical protein
MENKDQNKQNGGGMGKRGVTRPEMSMEKGHQQDDKKGHDSGMMMGNDQRKEMLHMHHMQTLWIYWTLVMLGIWMVASPLTFDYGKNVVEPSGGRDVWLSMGGRIAAMQWSDIISGLLLIFFGWRSFTPNRPYSVWICPRQKHMVYKINM